MMQKCPSTLSYVQTDRIWYFSLLDPLACGNPKAAEKGVCIWSPPRKKIFVTGIFFLIYPKCFPRDSQSRKLSVFLGVPDRYSAYFKLKIWSHALIGFGTKIYASKKNYKSYLNTFFLCFQIPKSKGKKGHNLLSLWCAIDELITGWDVWLEKGVLLYNVLVLLNSG